ncbi:Peroxisomal bioproteinsis factor 2 [Sphaceloma murrayae]|uniref:RING-type E3 ubiquitin transferase (cysteine targeting) n=1 Tax=Sphaceloma murrayae TaxID=2082308 RepID=A0A2K1QGC5_9PEZI|nr:Peroxisomal bioproteinsis factor 2 [Sphaceloma murrayae]
MSGVDFAAAQQRILARRLARSNASPPTRTTPSPSLIPSLPSSLPPQFLALPAPLRTLASSSLSLFHSLQSPYGTRPAFRVGQLDAELLDEELLTLFKGQVSDALKHYGTHLSDEWGLEIVAALRAVLWKLSIWDRGVSYGGWLQGLRYGDARNGTGGEGKALGQPTWGQKVVYGLVTVGGRYGWEKWEDWLLEREGYDAPPFVERLGRLTRALSTGHEIAAFASFLVFLYNGRYRTLVDRVLGLRLVPTSAQTSREVSFEYLNRQLVWHAFTEFLLFILPLVGISRWRRWLAKAWKKAKSMVTRKSEDHDDTIATGELGFLPERTCAICYKDQNPTTGASEADVLAASSGGGGVIGSAQTDITNPYEALPCGCLYDFVCLAQRIEAEEGEGWICLRCGEIVHECKPWSGDVIEENSSRSASGSKGSRKSVVFAAADNEEEEEEVEEVEDVDGEEELRRALSPVDPMPLDDEGADEDTGPSDRDTLDENDIIGESTELVGYEDADADPGVDGASDVSDVEGSDD